MAAFEAWRDRIAGILYDHSWLIAFSIGLCIVLAFIIKELWEYRRWHQRSHWVEPHLS